MPHLKYFHNRITSDSIWSNPIAIDSTWHFFSSLSSPPLFFYHDVCSSSATIGWNTSSFIARTPWEFRPGFLSKLEPKCAIKSHYLQSKLSISFSSHSFWHVLSIHSLIFIMHWCPSMKPISTWTLDCQCNVDRYSTNDVIVRMKEEYRVQFECKWIIRLYFHRSALW